MLTTSVISNNVNNIRATDSDIPYMFYVCYNNKTYPAPLWAPAHNPMIIRNDRYLTQENHWTLLNHLLSDNK